MDEKTFWDSLEYRVSREFAGMPERRYQGFWCDGFLPGQYILNGPSPRITGRCWICQGQEQAAWSFSLLLPQSFDSPDEIVWAVLLPAENMTRWMSFDEAKQYLELEPAVAKPARV